MCGICFICSLSAKSPTAEDLMLGPEDQNCTQNTVGICGKRSRSTTSTIVVPATTKAATTINSIVDADTNGPCDSASGVSRIRKQEDADLMMNTVLCDPLLHHRGPDVSRNHAISLAENLTGYMQGCVLHLRGHLTPQPVTDADGNAFLWNGEVFDGIEVEEHENDTQVLFGHLVKCFTEEDVLKTMQKVHGPWAFIFWQADTQKLWFGRDMYGRRSLLWHLPLSTTDHLVLTSVALGEMAYTEIPSVGIFCLDYSQIPPSSAGASYHCPVLTLFPWKDCRWPGTFLPVIETDEENFLAFLYPNLTTFMSVRIDRRSILDSWIPDINSQLPAEEASSLNTSIDLTNCASLEDMLTNILNARSDLDALADELIRVLQSSVDKRVKNLPRNHRSCQCQIIREGKNSSSACGNHVSLSTGLGDEVEHLHFHESETPVSQANVAVLFSGGLDSTVLAALADRCVPEGEPIDLLNVAFEQSVTTNISKQKTKAKQKKPTSCRKTVNRRPSLTDMSAVETTGFDQIKQWESNSSNHNCEHSDNCVPSELHLPKEDIVLHGCSAADLLLCKERSSKTHLSKNKDNIVLTNCSTAGLSACKEKSSESHFSKDNVLNGYSAVNLSTCSDLPSSVLQSLVSEQVHLGDNSSRPVCGNSTSSLENDIENISRAVFVDRFNVPDRQTGLLALSELNPKRVWNFVKINVSQAELQDLRKSHIRRLIYPLQTVLDDSIGCAVWFAARGSGVLPHNNEKFISKAKVLLCGMAADEQFAGYSRHRVTFQTKGWAGLLKEIQEEMWRISARNLGRDDRIITDHGKECRFPFLDETFTRFVSALPLCQRADLHLPRGIGDKLLLRLCAVKLGLVRTASQPKRAIQFGSRIAKLDKRKEKGSDVCDRLA